VESHTAADVSEKVLPLDPLGAVGLAWALASKSDQNGNASHAYDYLNELIKTQKDDANAVKFLNALIPVFFGVVSKLSAARDRALSSFEKVDDLKKTELERLNQISGLGTSVQGVITRSVVALTGGFIGFLSSVGSGNTIAVPISVIVGLIVGLVVLEVALKLYKIRGSGKVEKSAWTDKEKAWDMEFTMEAHRATLSLYKITQSIVDEVYGPRKKRTRDLARDYRKIIEMFMQRPTADKSSASRLNMFLNTSELMELAMHEFIQSHKSLQQDFQRNKADFSMRGLESLSTFLYKRQLIKQDLYNQILEVKKYRKRLLIHADYSGFDEKQIDSNNSNRNSIETEPISYTEGVYQSLKQSLGDLTPEKVHELVISRHKA
jgi:hypothetical protein